MHAEQNISGLIDFKLCDSGRKDGVKDIDHLYPDRLRWH